MHKGPIDRKSTSKPRKTNRRPEGLDAKTTYPLTKRKGLKGKGASRVLKGTDKRKGGKSVVVNEKANKLDGKYF